MAPSLRSAVFSRPRKETAMRQLAALALALTLAAPAAAQDRPVLTVYTYDGWVSDWGAGPKIEPLFEDTCGCDLRFVGAGDGAAVLSRLQLEGARTEADVVLGLDTALMARAKDTGLFAAHGQTPEGLTLPVAWTDDTFLPYDWGYFAFVYDEAVVTDPPSSIR